ncbi:MAG: UDP-N-acetylmuramoyl-L-alanyl-D-glutamate--2,6-diaminopimelate ligase [Methylobacter tundripaludum]|nr:UDP-N-acetylmuramoyl-L-alanyl-D-glutamate--2,6-diaminopimelate ligase [Methylobacter tundripaludum]
MTTGLNDQRSGVLLKDLLIGLTTFSEQDDMPVAGLVLDSRESVCGDVFVALAGAKQHGLAHVEQAINNGACAVIFDPAGNGRQLAEAFRCDSSTLVPMIAVENLGLKLGELAARFYGDPSQFMTVIGITGTNGKTSCSQFLSQMLDDCGIIGTLGWGEWGKLNKTLNTTPDALAIQKILAELLKDKKRTVAMEVSSHGLEQGRVNGVTFKGAVFTNISRDHLDYHGTMDAYVQAKLALLKQPGLAFAAVNLDGDYSERIIAAVPESVQLWQFSVKGKIADSGECVSAENIRHKTDGIEFDVRFRDELQRVQVPLFGDFNVENVLAVLTVMLAMDISLDDDCMDAGGRATHGAVAEAVKKLAGIKPVDGRMERFGAGTDPMIFVDYAHTPDALDKVLSSLRKHCKQALWVVFGCGGNRDTGKRPQMGKIAEQWADHVVITDDNPRYENGLDIVNDILAGCSLTAKDGGSVATGMEPVRPAKVEVIQNREQAIQKVVASAAKNDCIVIAGKGHEQYQESNGVCVPFSDREVVIDALNRRKVLGNCSCITSTSCIHAVEGGG